MRLKTPPGGYGLASVVYILFTALIHLIPPSHGTEFYTLPINPYWTDFLHVEMRTLAQIGSEVDEIKIRKSIQCPIGGTDESAVLAPNWTKSLTFYLKVLILSFRSFEEAIEKMKSTDTAVASEELRKFGFHKLESAQAVAKGFYSLIDKFLNARRSFQVLDEELSIVPGHNMPRVINPMRNLRQLALLIEGAIVNEEEPELEIEPNGRQNFIKIFERGYNETASVAEAAIRASILLNNFMHDKKAFEDLISAPNPDEGLENENDQYDEARPWTIPGIFERIADFAHCWEEPLFSIYDLTMNQLGPLPDPSPPKWVWKMEGEEDVSISSDDDIYRRIPIHNSQNSNLESKVTLSEPDPTVSHSSSIAASLFTHTRGESVHASSPHLHPLGDHVHHTFLTMLPLTLLTTVQGHPLLVELKNGETLNGHLVSCDTWMNLTLKEVIQTSPDGEIFHRLPEAYVRGNNIKYLRVPDEIIDIVKEQQAQQAASGDHHRSGGGERGGGNRRGDRGGRGDHRGDRGRSSGRGEFRGRGGGGGRGGRGRGN
ncbi:hypothetical protein H072_9821 [Dactylellina haptotyla CBS 200.50]|uniref:Sm domain-containing protein n=1 Tax=Dactylellina haptotyla (strain CBS 200.50) TaxID=1284197 RepID=S8A670_DACHA|nr:hypothetical protein H072_9821 [Dactylellina haptotyla CBS 200.50]